jgi:hypothetical protein
MNTLDNLSSLQFNIALALQTAAAIAIVAIAAVWRAWLVFCLKQR